MTKKRSNYPSSNDEGAEEEEDQSIAATLRLVETTDQALELMDSLAGQKERFEGNNNNDGPVGDMFDQMEEMRKRLQTAWKDVVVLEEGGENDKVTDINEKNHPAHSTSSSNDEPSTRQGTKRGRDGSNVEKTKEADDDKFREAYVNSMTEVLADPLDAMRQQCEDTNVPDMDIDLLVDALQSGIDLLHPEEKMLFLEELNAMEQPQEEKDASKGESIHCIRQKEMGYDDDDDVQYR